MLVFSLHFWKFIIFDISRFLSNENLIQFNSMLRKCNQAQNNAQIPNGNFEQAERNINTNIIQKYFEFGTNLPKIYFIFWFFEVLLLRRRFYDGRTFVPQIWEYGNLSIRKLIFTLYPRKPALSEKYSFLTFS